MIVLTQGRLFAIVAPSDAEKLAGAAALAAIVPDEARAAIPIHTTAIATAIAVVTILEWVVTPALQIEAFMARFQISNCNLRAVRAVRFEIHQKRSNFGQEVCGLRYSFNDANRRNADAWNSSLEDRKEAVDHG